MRKNIIRLSKILFFNFVVFLFISCGDSNIDLSSGYTPPDYSLANSWLAIPATTKNADIFYVYPTAWYKTNINQENICAINNAMMHTGAAAAFNRQATAFETVGNMFAPFYRQADPFYTLSLTNEERNNVISGIPANDLINAFDYYIKHFNNNRPFILVGHSQGSHALLFLLSNYMTNHPDVYQRMVAAYILGYPVTQEYLNNNAHLKFAENADDTQVIISYNTQSESVTFNLVMSNLIGLAINPISWTRNDTIAIISEGLGSYMPDTQGVFTATPQYADAKVDTAKGVIICSTANDSELILSFGPGIYHSYDIPFYYFNLRQNAQNRLEKYLSGQ